MHRMTMEAENNKLGYTDIHEDVVRSIVVTGPKYYATLATAGGLALVCLLYTSDAADE